MEYLKDKPPYKSELTISNHLKKEALKYANMKNFVHRKGDDEKAYCYMTAGTNEDQATEAMVDRFLFAEHETFDEFINHMFDLYEIVFEKDPSNWQNTTRCSCPAFASNYICKHIVAMAYKLKLLKDDKKAVLEGNPKAGRPASVTKGKPLQKD